ncbi:hypothetical protein [Kaistella montana]|uniref:Uncharacterized protein n=1 Tax=Kaistella montana TaxID=1849733 RepID=A0ABW5KBK7_9FLAO|nr:hypothetical protein [Kaistella montana]MCQ4036048.1 hypothetical protein [Kaistella montana]
MDRDYIIVPEQKQIPRNQSFTKKLDDNFWIELVHYHLLNFYKNYPKEELRSKIEAENNKPKGKKKEIEDVIKSYIVHWLENIDKKINYQGIILNQEPKSKYNNKGFYDLKFQHSYWINHVTDKLNYYVLECKNLSTRQNLINEYVYVDAKDDGGIYRYFNGKYAQEQSFGGMIGFILRGEVKAIKQKIIEKLQNSFKDQNGRLISNGIIDNSLYDNDFTFQSSHLRNEQLFNIYHLLLNVS